MAKFSIERALGWGFRTVWDNLGLILAAALTWFGVTIVLEALKVVLLGTEFQIFNLHIANNAAQLQIAQLYENPRIIGFSLAQLVLQLIQEALKLGMIKIGLDLYDTKKATYETLFTGFRVLIKYLVATFLYGLAVAAGTVLLIIPGIYLAMRYWFYSYVLVDKDLGIIDSLKESAVISEGVKWYLLGYTITVGILLHLGYLTLIGIIYIWPALQLANVFVYRKCGQKATSQPVHPE